MLLEGMSEVQKLAIVYEDNQGAILLANNWQVGICTKHIDVRQHSLKGNSRRKVYRY